MKNETEIDFHEKLIFGILMAGIGGFLDTYTYILHNGVFANAQTGNIVFIGISLINNQIGTTSKYVCPVLAFIVGVFISEKIKQKKGRKIDWSVSILIIEITILFIIGFLPSSIPDVFITTTIAFISSLQITSFKKVENSHIVQQ